MPEEKTDDLEPTEKTDAPEGGEKAGEGKEGKDYSQLTDDEVLEFLKEEEKERIAGLGLSTEEFDSWDKVGGKLKEMMEDDTRVYGTIKKMATQVGLTPRQFMDSWEKTGVPPSMKKEERVTQPQQKAEFNQDGFIRQMRIEMGKSELRTHFELFKLKMEGKGTPVSNKMKGELEKYMTAVVEMNEGNLDGINLYEEAYPFYQKGEEIKENRKKTSKDKLDLKRRQLEISGKKAGGVALDVGKASWEGQYEP